MPIFSATSMSNSVPACCLTRAKYYKSQGMTEERALECARAEHANDLALKRIQEAARNHEV
jgi:hypothetical protein